MSTPGRSLELFFIDGRPDGMLTAEVFNWTGHVLRVPRLQIREALARREAGFTGVYLLIGERDGAPLLYIGETEDMRERLRSHVQGKDWWDTAVLITTAADMLHKAHVKYLEARLVEIARDIGAIRLENGNTPPRSSLNEAATANMEAFIETLMMVLPAIGVEVFLSRKRSETTSQEASRPMPQAEFVCRLPKGGVDASAVLENGEWIMRKGSVLRDHWIGDPKHNPSYVQLRKDLEDLEIIVVEEGRAVMATDFAFSSPSAAAAVAVGRATNGRTSWINTKTGQTYAEWEEAQVTEGAP